MFWLPVPMAETLEELDKMCFDLYGLHHIQLLGKGVIKHHYDQDDLGIKAFYNDQLTKDHDVPDCETPPKSLWIEPVKIVSDKDSDLQTMKQIEAKHGMKPEQVQHLLQTPDELRAYADQIEERDRLEAEAEKETVAEKLSK